MIFQRSSVARYCPAPLTISDIKRELLYNFTKIFKGRHFMGHSGPDFQLLLNSKSSERPSSFKKSVENTCFGTKEKGSFVQILL